MFMLNLLFAFDRNKGLFSEDRSSDPNILFRASKNWLKLVPDASHPEPPDPYPPLPAGFNVETATWIDTGDVESGSLLIPKVAAGALDDSSLGVRLVPDPDSAVAPILGPGATGAELTLAICFGRPVQAGQERASPFVSGGQVLTTFVFEKKKSNTVDSAGNPAGWFFPLARVKFRPTTGPGSKHQGHRYQFAVGIIVTSAGTTRHFGQDPEMDVGD